MPLCDCEERNGFKSLDLEKIPESAGSYVVYDGSKKPFRKGFCDNMKKALEALGDEIELSYLKDRPFSIEWESGHKNGHKIS